MTPARMFTALALLGAVVAPAWADDITDAMDQARKSYQAGDLGGTKQSLDLASQLIGQKNAEVFATLLPNALPGWKAEKPQITAFGAVGFGASTASRTYNNPKGDHVEVQITGDSAMVSQIATFLNNPAMAGAIGKLVRVGSQRAIQDGDGNVKMIVGNKFMISVEGSADSVSKLAYAQAIDVAKLSKM
jgi:hypothetical protein